MWRRVVAGLAKHRVLATNSFVFGSLSGLAELSQQGLLRRLGSEDQKKKPINWSAVGRYVFVGGLVFSPVLTVWYRWLDGRMPVTDTDWRGDCADRSAVGRRIPIHPVGRVDPD